MLLGDRLHDRESEAGAIAGVGSCVGRPVELVEDAVEVVGRDPDPGVGDLDAEPSIGFPQPDRHASAARRVSNGVADQVAEELLQAGGIALDRFDRWGDLGGDRDAGAGRRVLHRGHDCLDQFVEPNLGGFDRHSAFPSAGEVEEILGDQ